MAGRRKSINDPWAWSAAQERAAILLADGVLTQQEVADEVGVTRQTVVNWCAQPEYQAHIAKLRREILERVRVDTIVGKEQRLQVYDDFYARVRRLMHARAVAYADSEVPGADTGLLAKTTRTIGSGENAMPIDEFVFDRALAREMREMLKQVAQEVGDWQERAEVTISIEDMSSELLRSLGIDDPEMLGEVIARARGILADGHGQ